MYWDTIQDCDKFTLIDHWENTKDKYPKCYTLKQLCYMENRSADYLRRHKKILPVRVDTSYKAAAYRNWESPTPYSVKYIRLDEIEAALSRMVWKRIHINLDWE